MPKKTITLNCTDIDKTVDAFEWVCKEHMKQLKYQGVDIDPQLRQREDYRVWIELVPDPDPRCPVWDLEGYQYLAPSAKIKFEAPPMGGKQIVTLCTRPLEGSDPTTSWLRDAEEIFESFRAYMQEAGYLDQQPQGPVPTEEAEGREPWEQIPDHNWDRKALELWCTGYTHREIGDKVGVTGKTVQNRMTDLRKFYGTEIVPYKKQLQQWWKAKDSG
jgi:hypothetical protein